MLRMMPVFQVLLVAPAFVHDALAQGRRIVGPAHAIVSIRDGSRAQHPGHELGPLIGVRLAEPVFGIRRHDQGGEVDCLVDQGPAFTGGKPAGVAGREMAERHGGKITCFNIRHAPVPLDTHVIGKAWQTICGGPRPQSWRQGCLISSCVRLLSAIAGPRSRAFREGRLHVGCGTLTTRRMHPATAARLGRSRMPVDAEVSFAAGGGDTGSQR